MRNKLLKIIVPALAYIAFGIFFAFMFMTAGECPYAKCISEIESDTYPMAGENSCVYEVEEMTIDHSDPFELAKIRGWIVEPKSEYYGAAPAELLLWSEDHTYSVWLFREKREDVVYMNQSDPNSKELNVGFTAYFPIDEIEPGEYMVGFLVKSGEEEQILTPMIFNTAS